MKQQYIITTFPWEHPKMYWNSNLDIGWTKEITLATMFNENEKQAVKTPLLGVWEPYTLNPMPDAAI